MAWKQKKVVRTSKPPLGTPIDWSNPLCRGLGGAWAVNEAAGSVLVNAASGNLCPAVNSPVWGPESLKFAASPYVNAGKVVPQSGPLTYLVIAKPGLLDSTANQILCGFGDRATLRFYSSSSAHFFTYNGTTWDNAFTTGTTFNTNTYYTLIAVHSGAQNHVYVDGISRIVAACTPRSAASQYDTYLGGEAENATRRLTGSIRLSLIFTRALSPAEIASLSANPWQIYEPEIVWVEDGATGGATVTSDLSIPWDMFQTVSLDLSIKWDLLNSVQSDLSVKFDLLNTVFADLAIPWDVYRTVNGDLSIVFDTRNTVQSDLQILWDSAGVVFSDLTLRWDLGDVSGRITIIGSGFRRIIG